LFEAASAHERALMNRALFLGVVMDPFKDGEAAAGDFLIRNVLGIDPQSKAVAVGALLREGQRVQFHVRDAQAAHQDLEEILRAYRARAGGAVPAGALLFSCLGRGEHMFGEPGHDSRVFAQTLGAVPLGGFFCNGEIGPVGGSTYIHGFTSAFGLFSPGEANQ
jgi:small ligand-binding sensory domain FIST